MMASVETILIGAGISIDAILKNTMLDPLETRILLAHGLGLSRVQLVTQSERLLTADEAQHLMQLFQRRAGGEPIAYILGEREFYGLALHITPDVLIPRPETELLVELALERLPYDGNLLDMGTGSGAIAIAVADNRPDVSVTALDASEDALAVAKRNATRHSAGICFIHSDWYDALAGQHFDCIVANPPYISAHDAHLSQGDLRFEPRKALTDAADGLSALRIIVAGARQYLAPGGWLMMEHGYDQAAAVRGLLAAQKFSNVQSWKDLAGIERVTGGVCHPEQVLKEKCQ